MEINEIITKFKDMYGDKIDVAKITAALKGIDTKGMSFSDIVEKVKAVLPIGDLASAGKDGAFENLKGKMSNTLGGMFHMA